MLKYSTWGTQSLRASLHLATTRYASTDDGCRLPFFLGGGSGVGGEWGGGGGAGAGRGLSVEQKPS